VTQFLGSLHVPVDFVLRHAEVMFENAALPERRGLLIFGDGQPLAGEITGLCHARSGVVRYLSVKQPPARKDRQGDHVKAAFAGDQIRRHRHLTDVELLKLELPPKSFRWMGVGRHDLDPFRLNDAFHQWIDPFIECRDEIQS